MKVPRVAAVVMRNALNEGKIRAWLKLETGNMQYKETNLVDVSN